MNKAASVGTLNEKKLNVEHRTLNVEHRTLNVEH